jgi:hypothetical protein
VNLQTLINAINKSIIEGHVENYGDCYELTAEGLRLVESEVMADLIHELEAMGARVKISISIGGINLTLTDAERDT